MKPIVFCIVLLSISAVFNVSGATKEAAVAMPDAFSEQVARDVLKRGGNAVDAAVAAQFVLAVTFPEAGNIGGGGLMTLWFDGQPAFLDYREKAPGKAHAQLYLDDDGNVIPNLSLYGPLASGVPGSVAGMWEAHQKYGSLPWSELVEPAIVLARDGFVVPPKLATMIEKHIAKLEKREVAVNFAEFFSSVRANERFVQPALADTLVRIQKDGKAGFYKGKTAQVIAEFMRDNGGLITESDLAAYSAVWRKPLMKNWRDYTIVTSPPPSSGGIAIVQWLTMFDLVKGEQSLALNSTPYVHALSEVGKRVFADRAEYLGDPDFYPVPVAKLVDDKYLSARSQDISLQTISSTPNIQPGLQESEDTTHFSILDVQGNAVSNTTTINLSFGSSMVVEGAGFLLNDEMDDFSAKPGVANFFGALGGNANAIAPNKRMLSSMTPTILVKQNQPVVVTGSPGGTTILSSVYQSILNVIEHGVSANDAVNAPRFHHQLYPENTIRMHDGFTQDVVGELKTMGYEIDDRRFGDLHMISAVTGKLEAASEANGRGVASVFLVEKD